MSGLISLVNDNHADSNLKEILVYVYFGSIVSNQPKIFLNIYPLFRLGLWVFATYLLSSCDVPG